MPNVSQSPTPDVVYHYTKFETLEHIVHGMKLRFGHVRPQNDEEEVLYFQKLAYEVASEELRTRGQEAFFLGQPLLHDVHSPDHKLDDIPEAYEYYIVCFSEDGDCKSQWAQYADDFNGVAIGFRPQYFHDCGFGRLKNCLRVESVFEHVCYDPKVKVKDELLRPLTCNAWSWMIGVFVFQHLHKDPLWHEEREWRLCYQPGNDERLTGITSLPHQPTAYSGDDQTLPFLTLNADAFVEVILGPHCESTESEVSNLLSSATKQAIPVSSSKLKLRRKRSS